MKDAGHWLPEAKALVHRMPFECAARPVWRFSRGPVGNPLLTDEDPVDVRDIADATGAREHRVFSGRMDTSGLGFGERAITFALRAPEGDFREWAAVKGWAREIAADLLRTGTPHRSA